MINKSSKSSKNVKSQNARRNKYNKKCASNAKISSRESNETIDNSSVRDYNDPNWYNASNQLLVDACSIGFATPLGLDLNVHGMNFKVPGIMKIGFVPSIGLSQDNTSPVNMAAQSIYSYVNYANSRNTSYDRTDMMMFLLAMDSAYSYLSFLKRIYGLARLYSATNRFLPDALISSMNVSFDDIMTHLSDFRAYINTYAAKLGSFFVPASFTYLQRHAWMNYNVFSDSDKPFKSQLYYYMQEAYYVYDETSSDKGTKLNYKEFFTDPATTFSQLAMFGDELLDPLLNSQDVGIMGSDMLKAFGESGLIKMNTIDSEFTVEIAYSPEVLTQIQNTIAVGNIVTDGSKADITQDPNTGKIIQTLTAKSLNGTYANTAIIDNTNYFLNMPMTNPSPDNVMVATRNMSWVGKDLLIHSGSDVVTRFTIYADPNNVNTHVELYTSSVVMNNDAAEGFKAYVEAMKYIPAFNMHPRIIMGARIGQTTDLFVVPNSILGDFENYTPLPTVDLQKMHEVALLSMFAVPQYGTFNG